MSLPPPSTTVASTDGITIAVHDLGGDGPPLLLCHATGFHGRVWLPVARALGPRAHAFAPDLRGHGDSPVPEGFAMDWWGFAHDVLAVVDALGLQGGVAAGHSKGGASLLLAEILRPGTFSSLYCFEPIVFPPIPEGVIASGNPLAESARRRRPSFPSFDDAIANFASKPPLNALAPDALDAYVRHGFRPTADGTVELKCRPETEARCYEMGGHHGGFARLGEVACPVVVARGRDDLMGPASFAPRIAEALPHGRLEEHPELGHFGPLEDPPRIAAAIAAALAL